MHKKLISTLSDGEDKSVTQLMEQWELALSKEISFREQLVKNGLIKESSYQLAISSLTGLQFVDEIPDLLSEYQEKFALKVPIRFVKKYLFYPFHYESDRLTLAVMDPWPCDAYDQVSRALGFTEYETVISTGELILEAINQGYDRNPGSAEDAAEVLEDDTSLNLMDYVSSDETEDLLDAEDEEPIKKLMNSILVQSVRDNSSDIHIDPTQKETIVRNRIDGVLRKVTTVPKVGHIPLVNRVKVMAGLDISTKNHPQDGRTMIIHAGKKVDIRVSIIPTVHGEQAVLRLLNQSQGIIPLSGLGMSADLSEQLGKLIQQPYGILLVTGPTGSGKTTTLYSALNRINADEKNIVTIEDPVEYRISNYGQMQVNEKVGVTFAKGLRAMLRQDPDVIMIGEMRDTETAQIAIRASLTGHLVLSTIHTNEAAATIVRLIDMGIEPYLVTSAISAVLAQRLVRKICPACKESYDVSWNEIESLNMGVSESEFTGKLWRGAGCSQCLNTGYQGRIGVFELLVMNEEIRKRVNQSTDTAELKRVAQETGMRLIDEDCAQKVLNGTTTLDEMLRVVFVDSEKGI